MRKRVFSIALILALLCALVLPTLPALPVSADSPHGKTPPGQIEKLEHGWRRLNPNTKVHKVGTEQRGGKKHGIYEAEISSLPSTLSDNKTLIDTNWYLLTDLSGQSYFQTGVNFFTARVQEGRISVEDEDGRLSIWDPKVAIGSESFGGGTAEIVDDPINENYKGNCLRWEYGSYSTGWFSSSTLTRYLRVIEGSITELWILPANPKANVV
ncbi:unnamed protein product, partial [marine sediment metagenome]